MITEDRELLIPEIAQGNPNSFEILRVWIANKNQHCSIQVGIWEDSAAWGIFLSDLAHHIVNAYEPQNELERVTILERIKMGFDLEIDSPTGSIEGEKPEK
jgi:Domain of unknown function (DUF5076)